MAVMTNTPEFAKDVERITLYHLRKFHNISNEIVKDAKQEAWMAALIKMQTWNQGKGAKPGTYVYWAIRNAVDQTVSQYQKYGFTKANQIPNGVVMSFIEEVDERSTNHDSIYDAHVRLGKLNRHRLALLNKVMQGTSILTISKQLRYGKKVGVGTIYGHIRHIVDILMRVT